MRPNMYGLMLCELYKFSVSLMPVCINCILSVCLCWNHKYAHCWWIIPSFRYYIYAPLMSPRKVWVTAQQCFNAAVRFRAIFFITSDWPNLICHMVQTSGQVQKNSREALVNSSPNDHALTNTVCGNITLSFRFGLERSNHLNGQSV